MAKKKDKKKRAWMGNRGDETVLTRRNASSGLYDSYMKSGFTQFRPKKGNDYCIRICPPSFADPAPVHWGLDVWFHDRIGADNGSFICYESMEKYVKKDFKISLEEFFKVSGLDEQVPDVCPICESRRHSTDEDYKNATRPKRRVIFWMIDRDDESVGAKLWSAPQVQVDRELLMLTGKAGSIIHVDDAYEGYDVEFRVEEQKGFPNYKSLSIDRNTSMLLEDEDDLEDLFDFLEENPLPSVINWCDVEYMTKIFKGAASTTDSAGDTDGEEEIDTESLTYDGLAEMKRSSLVQVADKIGFSAASIRKSSTEELVNDICEELDIKVEEEEEEEEEESTRESAKKEAEKYRGRRGR